MSVNLSVSKKEIRAFQSSKTFPKPKLITSSSKNGLGDIARTLFQDYFIAHENNIPKGELYSCILKEIEKPLIEECLKAVKGNQKKASEILGLNRNTLRKKMTDLKITVKSPKS